MNQVSDKKEQRLTAALLCTDLVFNAISENILLCSSFVTVATWVRSWFRFWFRLRFPEDDPEPDDPEPDDPDGRYAACPLQCSSGSPSLAKYSVTAGHPLTASRPLVLHIVAFLTEDGTSKSLSARSLWIRSMIVFQIRRCQEPMPDMDLFSSYPPHILAV